MKKLYFLMMVLLGTTIQQVVGQEIQTIFRNPGTSGGYAGFSNKFTMINGGYANLAEVYGGWFINRRFLLGIGVAASTNDIRVPEQYSMLPEVNMTYQYTQAGLVTEYVFGSNRAVHFNFTLFTGGGLTFQYRRDPWYDWDSKFSDHEYHHDENFFLVLEPGVQLEANILRWLRLSPGISYRRAFGSEGAGLTDDRLSNISYNITLKIGKF
jgi:hypothetical protein